MIRRSRYIGIVTAIATLKKRRSMIKRSRTPQAAANRTELSETTVLNYDTHIEFPARKGLSRSARGPLLPRNRPLHQPLHSHEGESEPCQSPECEYHR